MLTKLQEKPTNDLTDIELDILNVLKSKQENGIMTDKEEILIK